MVLVGDDKQLEPTIKSDEARDGLSHTLFERVMKFRNMGEFKTILVEQYRMSPLIMQWSSNQMYEGQLRAHPSVSERK